MTIKLLNETRDVLEKCVKAELLLINRHMGIKHAPLRVSPLLLLFLMLAQILLPSSTPA